MTHAVRATTVVLLGALALAGCGSADAPQPATRSGGDQLTVTETDFELGPAEARLARGDGLTIMVTNAGKTSHALTLETGGETRSTGTIEPGKSAILSADLEPGRYTWYCPVGDHRELGMSGTLTVGAEATETEPSEPAAAGGGY